MLHTDAFENLHCLVSGVKEFVLIDPEYTDVIGPELRAQGYYSLDVDRWVVTAPYVGGYGIWFGSVLVWIWCPLLAWSLFHGTWLWFGLETVCTSLLCGYIT